MSLKFDAQKLKEPGVYSDVIHLKRSKDDLTLLKIPVVVEISKYVSEGISLDRIDEDLQPFDIYRKPLLLLRRSPIKFEGFLLSEDEGENSEIGFIIRDASGIQVDSHFFKNEQESTSLSWMSPSLAPGSYEVLVFRNFLKPAVLNTVKLSGVLKFPSVRVVGIERESATSLHLAFEAEDQLSFRKAVLHFDREQRQMLLQRNGTSFTGTLDLGHSVDSIFLGLEQEQVDFNLERLLHMEVLLSDSNDHSPLVRTWVNLQKKGGLNSEVDLSANVEKINIRAFSNIERAEFLKATQVKLHAVFANSQSIETSLDFDEDQTKSAAQTFDLSFTDPLLQDLAADALGSIDFFNAHGTKVESIPVEFNTSH